MQFRQVLMNRLIKKSNDLKLMLTLIHDIDIRWWNWYILNIWLALNYWNMYCVYICIKIYQNPDDLPPGGFFTRIQDLWSSSPSSENSNKKTLYPTLYYT